MTHPATLDPLLLALVEKLPRADGVFTTGDRERWLLAMDSALQLLYPPEWTQEARQRAKEARSEAEASDEPKPCVPVSCPPVKEQEIAAHVTTLEWAPTVPQEVIDGAMEALRRHVEGTLEEYGRTIKEEAPSTTSADAVEDAGSSAGEPMTTGADAADATSSPETSVDSQPESAPSSPSSGETAPSTPSLASTEYATGGRITREQAAVIAGVAVEVPAPEQGKKRHFTADQKGAILRRVVREGQAAVVEDTMIHTATLNRWAREMPQTMARHMREFEAEAEALAEAGPTAEELEAERKRPIPPPPERRPTQEEAIAKRAAELAAKPPVQWPSAPIERRPVDHERTRRDQADWA